MADQDKVLDEIRKRVIRTETRVMALGNKLGYDLKDEDEVTIVVKSCSAYIGVLDISLSTIINRARRAGLHGNTVGVFYDGQHVADVEV
jgi:hypothetical protein